MNIQPTASMQQPDQSDETDGNTQPNGGMDEGVTIELHERPHAEEPLVQAQPEPVLVQPTPIVISPDPITPPAAADIQPEQPQFVQPAPAPVQVVMPAEQYQQPVAAPEPAQLPPEPAPQSPVVLQPEQPMPSLQDMPTPAPPSAFVAIEPALPRTPAEPQPHEITSLDANQWFQSNAPTPQQQPIPVIQDVQPTSQPIMPVTQPMNAMPQPMMQQPLQPQPQMSAPAAYAAVPPTSALPPLAAETGENPNRSYLVALLLAYFFGALGVDRFYLGKTKTAIAKLLTLGGFGVWIAIDLVLIGLGRQQAANDPRPLSGFSRNYSWVKVVAILVAVVNFIIPVIVVFIIMVSQTIQLNQREEEYTQRTSQTESEE